MATDRQLIIGGSVSPGDEAMVFIGAAPPVVMPGLRSAATPVNAFAAAFTLYEPLSPRDCVWGNWGAVIE